MKKSGKIFLVNLQIIILIVGIIAISYAIGSGIGGVHGISSLNDPERASQAGLISQGNTPLPADSDKTLQALTAKEKLVKVLTSNYAIALYVTAAVSIAVGIFTSNKQGLAVAQRMGYGLTAQAVTSWAFKQLGLKEISIWKGITFGTASWIIGGAVALYFLITWRDKKQDLFIFSCYSWDAPKGGEKCEECNKQGDLPCSDYQCRSLGQSCQLLNPGTDEEQCAWVNRNDVEYPIIQPWEDALLDRFRYTPDNTISPPDRGVKVENIDSTTKCVKAFSPVAFGVALNEPAQCKLDVLRKNTYDEMDLYFSSALLQYNHSYTLSLPGANALAQENITVQNNGQYDIFVRCQDANGNSNVATFVFKYCVEQGPDVTPPLIVSTNFLNNMPIAYNQTSLDLEVYVNEPADCRWSHLDQSYDNMENEMQCPNSIFEMNSQMLYTCTTTLTGIKDRTENKFYFKCKDQPLATEDRNTNSESYEFTVIGTQPLVIDSVGPNETVKDSTLTVKVTLEAETSAGYDEGKAICYYSDTGQSNSYNEFYNTNSYVHSQDLYLEEGDYNYFIKCVDLGGNTDTKQTSFHVETDSESPIVVRAYHEASYLVIITNEESECVYSNDDCNYLFDDGTKMTAQDDTKHFTDWNTQREFFIKCKDTYNNQPNPNECSIIVRPFE